MREEEEAKDGVHLFLHSLNPLGHVSLPHPSQEAHINTHIDVERHTSLWRVA